MFQIKTWFQNRRMKEKRQIKGVEERLGGTMPVPAPTVSPHAVLGYPTGTEYLGCSPASSPGLSPTGATATMTVPNPATPGFTCMPSVSAEPSSFYGQMPTPLTISTSPVPSIGGAVPFAGHYPYPGVSPMDFLMSTTTASMMPTPLHTLMGQAIL